MKEPKEPIARGVIVSLAATREPTAGALRKEIESMLKPLDAAGLPEGAVLADADFILVIVDEDADPGGLALPDLTNRAASVLAVGEDAPTARAAIARARKRLRAAGASLGARELLFHPDQFGYLGLESDGLRERLEILMRTLVLDAEGLRLRREGWEDPIE